MQEVKSGDNVFVFVVCGAQMHIDTLHLSLKALLKYTANKVWVLTDSSRNETPVTHTHVIDIKTPDEFNHHQASIFLKTGIHNFLPAGNNYCYLDTDVIAVSAEVDEIFGQFRSPVTFCSDITRLAQFSPFAVKCNCYENFERDKVLPALYERKFLNEVLPELKAIDKSLLEIERRVAATKQSKLVYMWHRLKYSLGGRYYQLDKDFMMEKSTGHWFNTAGKLLWYSPEEIDILNYISRQTGFSLDRDTNQWLRVDGTSVSMLYCNHLVDFIKDKFNITIAQPDWQQWNGGVFLFNDESHPFLEEWHNKTLAVFKDKRATTRDQGTLVATVWQYGLQNHYTLPLKFNFIADYEVHKEKYLGNLQFKIGAAGENIAPVFIHVYKHWGDTSWNMWNAIIKHIAGNEG
ncbi:MAG TPA: hypothetical protein VK154_08635 [Chitinophagales bacterium]|nr:hypothetical protein [Chitinophagales bacterium]